MHIQPFTRLGVATTQIDTACDLFLAGKDFISSLTLAGAGEEILGMMLRKRGEANALENAGRMLMDVRRALFGNSQDHVGSMKVLNAARNDVKHLTAHESAPIQMDPQFEAANMIHRAIENYHQIELTYTDQMQAFLSRPN